MQLRSVGFAAVGVLGCATALEPVEAETSSADASSGAANAAGGVGAASTSQSGSGPGGLGGAGGGGATGGRGGGAGEGGVGGRASAGGASAGGASAGGAAGAGGGAVVFPDVLGDGVWLIGWSGGLEHYSWVRYTLLGPTWGDIDVLDPVCPACTPYFPCQGAGTFTSNPAQDLLVHQLPPGCGNLMSNLIISGFGPTGGFPPAALQKADMTDLSTMSPITSYQFPAGHCDAQMTVCQDPFL